LVRLRAVSLLFETRFRCSGGRSIWCACAPWAFHLHLFAGISLCMLGSLVFAIRVASHLAECCSIGCACAPCIVSSGLLTASRCAELQLMLFSVLCHILFGCTVLRSVLHA
jgi:hypothetical protein